jgi:hypothetical protein
MTFTQSGWGNSAGCANCGAGISGTTSASTMDGVTSVDGLIATLAPVINSNFASGFMISQSPDRYMFERGGSAQACGAIQSIACGIGTGLDSMVKNYTGGTYTATTGDVISAGMYIFATTAFPESASNISATFNLVGGCGVTTADVIGESRSRTISGCSFTDTFPYAWTTHVYHVH